MENRAGKWRKNLSGEAAYYSFIPSPLPPEPPLKIDATLSSALVAAHAKLAHLEGIASHIPNMDLFVSMYIRKEALLSSQIEGTQATLEDVFAPDIAANTNRNVQDVVNYIRATYFALERLHKLPLCNRLLRETHAVLLHGVRGADKEPGEFRHSQNWIGGQGSTLKNARYIPPCPEDMTEAISSLEKYIHAEDNTDVLIRAALIHYQFETIHPFLDGNGRIGRLLITLFLLENRLLTTPALYISYFLKRNRVEYYDRMTEVRRSGNYEQWVQFFLTAIADCADDAAEAIDELTALHEQNTARINTLKRAAVNTRLVFDYLEAHPIIDIKQTAAALQLSYNTVSTAVKRLTSIGILQQTSLGSRNRTFAYEAYLTILRRGTL